MKTIKEHLDGAGFRSDTHGCIVIMLPEAERVLHELVEEIAAWLEEKFPGVYKADVQAREMRKVFLGPPSAEKVVDEALRAFDEMCASSFNLPDDPRRSRATSIVQALRSAGLLKENA